jgi:YD repeat-containing protein
MSLKSGPSLTGLQGGLLIQLGLAGLFIIVVNSAEVFAYGSGDADAARQPAANISDHLMLAQVTPQATYGYDGAGRTATVVYTDQTCIVHTYDAAGNRVTTTVTVAGPPATSVWGSGAWGCSKWDHP